MYSVNLFIIAMVMLGLGISYIVVGIKCVLVLALASERASKQRME